MNLNSSSRFISRGAHVKLAYKLTVDGYVVASKPKKDPLEFIQGNGEIISGLENALFGLRKSDRKTIKIQALQAYGEINPSLIVKINRSELPPGLPLLPGVILEARDATGNPAKGKILKVDEDQIIIDYNHPFAGKTLEFEIEVIDIR